MQLDLTQMEHKNNQNWRNNKKCSTTTGSITISRTNHDLVTIRIKDDKSMLPIVEMELSLENYALLITGLGRIKGELSIFDNYESVAKER